MSSLSDQQAMEQSFRYAKVVAEYMCEQCDVNKEFLDTNHFTRFHSSGIPNISLPDYLRRIAKYSHCSGECFVVALVYIMKYCKIANSELTMRNAHRLCITAVMVAAKLRDDVFYANKYYSSIGGISSRELNELELDLLVTINWETWVDRKVFESVTQQCEQIAQKRAIEAEQHAQQQQNQQQVVAP